VQQPLGDPVGVGGRLEPAQQAGELVATEASHVLRVVLGPA
jgi:hypothetical protein